MDGQVLCSVAPPFAGEGEPRSGGRERASGGQPPLPNPSPAEGEGLLRPQRLLDRPEAIDVIYATPEGMPRRFIWRRAVHDIARAEGPERIAPEWWRQPGRRGCAIIIGSRTARAAATGSTAKGLIGDGRGGAPGWFIHGLFG